MKNNFRLPFILYRLDVIGIVGSTNAIFLFFLQVINIMCLEYDPRSDKTHALDLNLVNCWPIFGNLSNSFFIIPCHYTFFDSTSVFVMWRCLDCNFYQQLPLVIKGNTKKNYNKKHIFYNIQWLFLSKKKILKTFCDTDISI